MTVHCDLARRGNGCLTRKDFDSDHNSSKNGVIAFSAQRQSAKSYLKSLAVLFCTGNLYNE